MPAFRGKLGCGERNVRGANGRETVVLKSSQSFDKKGQVFFLFRFTSASLISNPVFCPLRNLSLGSVQKVGHRAAVCWTKTAGLLDLGKMVSFIAIKSEIMLISILLTTVLKDITWVRNEYTSTSFLNSCLFEA